MTYNHQPAFNVNNAPAFQFPPAGLFIPFGIPSVHPDAAEVCELRLRLVELFEQKAAVEADRQRIASDKANLEASLEQSKEYVEGLKTEVKELRKREKAFQRRMVPETLFVEVLAPMVSTPSPTH